MPNQSTGAPFLERVLRTGRKRMGLLDTVSSGGVNMPDPQGLSSGQAPPPRPTPAAGMEPLPSAVGAGAPAAPSSTPPPGAGTGAAPAPAQPAQPENFSLPPLDYEYPIDRMGNPEGQVFPARSLWERFYRRMGRMPGPKEAQLLNYRQQFETQVGRTPNIREVQDSLEADDRGDLPI